MRSQPNPIAASCQSLYKRYGKVQALDGVSLDVHQGELMAILGPSGCGKTTLLRLLAGFEAPDAGAVILGERLVAGNGAWVPPEARHVGIVFQDYALFPHMTVGQNVEFGLNGWNREARARRARELLEMMHMAHMMERRPHELSGGEQQRVALARSLAPNPVALFLDEPFSNLDAPLRLEMRAEMKGIVRQLGLTTVLVTHDQEEAMGMGDRVSVMSAGRIEQVGTPEEVFHHPNTRFVAQFMRVGDFLPATVTEEGLATELGLLKVPHGFPLGSKVEVLVRPDRVKTQPSEDGVALVERRIFRGMHYLYWLSLPSGGVLHALQHPPDYYEIGKRLNISISTEEPPVCFAAEDG